jgi:uncharacterized membrane protein (UPF0182 family)
MISKSLLSEILKTYKYNNILTLDPEVVKDLAHYIVEQYFLRSINNDTPTEVFAACRILDNHITHICLDWYKTEWIAKCTLEDGTEYFSGSASDTHNKLESALVNLATAIVERK